MLLAAIDIGSNASRLLFANVFDTPGGILVEKASLVRIPTRLGEDVFSQGKISGIKAANLLKTLKAFSLLMEVYRPERYEACATAAMREATNNREVLSEILSETGIRVRIIDGMEEAELVRQTAMIASNTDKKYRMFVDVGGGSTEISLLNQNVLIGSASFRIGTLRLLKGKVKKDQWDELSDWMMQYQPFFANTTLIGTGGNINKISKLFGDPGGYSVTRRELKSAHTLLRGLTLEERIVKLGLRPDRADVIVPAARIYLFIMKAAGARAMTVPRRGLADGLIYRLFAISGRRE